MSLTLTIFHILFNTVCSLSYFFERFLKIEALLREKMKTGYYDIRGAFKNCDPEGKGIVNR